jgi:hypothetical protein
VSSTDQFLSWRLKNLPRDSHNCDLVTWSGAHVNTDYRLESGMQVVVNPEMMDTVGITSAIWLMPLPKFKLVFLVFPSSR